MYGPIRTETTARCLLYVPKRYFMHGKKNFFPLHLRKKIKKWNSNFTFINVPCKFQKDRPNKVAMGINGLIYVDSIGKQLMLHCELHTAEKFVHRFSIFSSGVVSLWQKNLHYCRQQFSIDFQRWCHIYLH